jgi:hypothetical protein
MNGRFLVVKKRMELGFAHAEKAREQDFVHLNQRLRRIGETTLTTCGSCRL